jgi:ribosomal protein S18 acetylase RimI-like enzyme
VNFDQDFYRDVVTEKDLTVIFGIQERTLPPEDKIPEDIYEALILDNVIFEKLVKVPEYKIAGLIAFSTLDDKRFRIDPGILDRFHRKLEKIVHFLVICIDTVFQHSNLATEWILRLHKEMKDLGYEGIFLEVASDNIPAIQCYTKLGYILIKKELRFYRSGRNALMMYCNFT